MKSQKLMAAAGTLLAVMAGSAYAATRVALIDFSSDDNSCRSQNAASAMTAAIQAQLGEIAGIQWVERTEIDALKSEVDLARSALAASDTIRLGRMLKADIAVRGEFVMGKDSRELVIEAIDLLHAEVLASASVSCPGNTLEPVNPTPLLLSDATDCAQKVLVDAMQRLKQMADRKTIGGLFIRNSSANDRLDYLTHSIQRQLGEKIDQTRDLRWLRFPRASDAQRESQLAVMGLTEGNGEWKSPADLFVWGSIEEKKDYTGPAEMVPFTISVEAWDGGTTTEKITINTTIAQWQKDLDQLTTRLMELGRKANPQFTSVSRGNVAKSVVARAMEMRAVRGSDGRPLAGGAGGSGPSSSLSRVRYICALYDLASFLMPDDRDLREQAWSMRKALILRDEVEYIGYGMLMGEYAARLEQYRMLRPDGNPDVETWKSFMDAAQQVLRLEQKNAIERGVPYDMSPAEMRRADQRIMQLVQRHLARAMALSNSQTDRKTLVADYDVLRLLTFALSSRADLDARVSLMEMAWPWIEILYAERRGSGDSVIVDFRTAVLSAYESAGQLPRAKMMLAKTPSGIARIETVKVPSSSKPAAWTAPATPAARPMPQELAANQAARRAEMLAGIARKPTDNPLADRGPIADVPLIATRYEAHPEALESFIFYPGGEQYSRRAMGLLSGGGYGAVLPESCVPVGLAGDVLWLKKRERESESYKMIGYRPALRRVEQSIWKDVASGELMGMVTLGKRTYGASATNGLVIVDHETQNVRVLGGAEGLATTSLDAIAAYDQTIILAGHDKRNMHRLIRFDLKTERFEDLLTDVAPNRQLWLWESTLIFKSKDGYVWMDMPTRKTYPVTDRLAIAGLVFGSAMDMRLIKVMGLSAQGLWVLYKDRLVCLAHDRKTLAADLSLKNVSVSLMTMTDHPDYAVCVANPWELRERGSLTQTTGSYLLSLDLKKGKWLAQCRIPTQVSAIVCAAGRVWYTQAEAARIVGVPYDVLKIPVAGKLVPPTDASVGYQMATAAYNGDLVLLNQLIARDKNELMTALPGTASPYKLAFSYAPIAVIESLLRESTAAGIPPGKSMMWAAMRNDPELIQLLSRQKAPEQDWTPTPVSLVPLAQAAMDGNAEAIAAFLTAGADINQKNQESETPLSLAILFHRNQAVKALLAGKPKLDTWHSGYTPLHIAIMTRDTELVRMLLDAGADIKAVTSPRESSGRPMTSLMLAVQQNDSRMVSLLLEKGADATVVLPNGDNAIEAARRARNEELMTLLSTYGAKVDAAKPESLRKALSSAMSSRNMDELRRVLDAGADLNAPDSRGVLPIAEAADHSSTEIIVEMLRRGAKPDVLVSRLTRENYSLAGESAYKRIAVAQAVIAGVATTQVAIPHKPPMPPEPREVLTDAVDARNIQTALEVLPEVQALGWAEKNEWPLLHRAIAGNMLLLIKPLAEKYDVLDQPGPEGMTPLMVAAANDNAAAVQELLNLGAETYLRNKAGMTAADIARVDGCKNAAALLDTAQARSAQIMIDVAVNPDVWTLRHLLTSGYSPNLRSANGQTPLMAAARHGWSTATDLLIESKADVNAQDHLGRTALHWLIADYSTRRNGEIIKKLIRAGAKLDIADKKGVTPQQLAESKKKDGIDLTP